MRHSFAWCFAALILLCRPVAAQLPDPAAIVVLGLVSAKNACVAAHPNLTTQLRDAYGGLIARNGSALPHEIWQAFDGLPPTLSSNPPLREDCAKLVAEFHTIDVDAVMALARAEAACLEEVDAATERAGPTRPAIGIELVEGAPDARIGNIHSNSPARAAGLLAGDIVVEFANRPIRSACELAVAVLTSKAGETVNVVVSRTGKQVQVEVTPVSVPNE